MIRFIQNILALVVLTALTNACTNPSNFSAGGRDKDASNQVMGSTPLTRTAWCTADIRENMGGQTRVLFKDNLEFEMALFQMNSDHTRGNEKQRQKGTWSQKDNKTLVITMDGGRSVDMKFELVLQSRDSKKDQLFMGPKDRGNSLFDPCP